MKKIILTFLFVLFCIIGADSRQVEAYSVNVQKDGNMMQLGDMAYQMQGPGLQKN